MNQQLCGLRKALSTQHALFRLIQSRQKDFDESGFVGTILMDHSKPYDCLPHDLMVAKLEAYDSAKENLQLINDYLSCRKQRTKIGSVYSDWANVIHGISIFLLMTFFLSLKSQTFVISRMVTLCIPMATNLS